MTAFLKIDHCGACQKESPWEWIPPISLAGKPLAGTGVWRSALIDGICATCCQLIQTEQQRKRRALAFRDQLIRILGGPKPYREFTLERYRVTAGNKLAFESAARFDWMQDNLYLWGHCGVGKTHLAVAIARRCFSQGRLITVTTPATLIRGLRMRSPDEEQQALDRLISVPVLVLDDLGTGNDTPYLRQVLQEILDGRALRDRGGLIVTSKYSLAALVRLVNDQAVSSRLAGMCRVVEIRAPDLRQGQLERRA